MEATSSKIMRGLRYLVALQMLSRVLTFVLNVVIVRRVAPSVLGVAQVQLEFLYSTVLYVARECVRRAAQRFNLEDEEGFAERGSRDEDAKVHRSPVFMRRSAVNLAWGTVPVGLVFAFVSTLLLVKSANTEELAMPSYSPAMIITALASCIELCAEAPYVVAQNRLAFRLRTVVEGAAVMARVGATYGLIVSGVSGDSPLLPFACGYVAYAVVVVVGYFGYFAFVAEDGLGCILPRLGDSPRWDARMWELTKTYFYQGIQKMFLTKGESIVLRSLETLTNQGVFSVVSNLGSLVVRFLFQPVEETATMLFSMLLGSKRTDQSVSQGLVVLAVLLKSMLLVGISGTIAPTVLSWYCVYVLVMAVNGVSEAFVQAVASTADLQLYNVIMVVFSMLYLIVAWFAVGTWNTVGMVVANSFNMLLRIGYSLYFMSKYFSRDEMKKLYRHATPSWVVMLASICSSIATHMTEVKYCGATTGVDDLRGCALHVGAGAIGFFLIVVAVLVSEREFIRQLRETFAYRGKPA